MNKNIFEFHLLTMLFLALVTLGTNAQAASFDCTKAQSKVEHLICDKPKVSALDDKLAKTYQDVMTKANDEEKQRLLTEQKHWLKYTRNVCKKDVCLIYAYWSRQAELETFFTPHPSLYKHESDKAETIKKILATAPLYLFSNTRHDTQFCPQILKDLKQMKDIRFIDPIVQTESFEDPALDPWRQHRKQKLPINMQIACDWKDLEDDPDGTFGLCSASFGLPPFKLFELPPLRPSGDKRYIFYRDGAYGPMNKMDEYKPGIGDGGVFRQVNIANDNAAVVYASAGRPSYNSIIEYRQQYYFLILATEFGSYKLAVESVAPDRSKGKQSCDWSSVKPLPPENQNKPSKEAKRKLLNLEGQ